MKTKDKIIFAAIELFNAQGEQNVTTNHIAAHLGMSPGNLYYHFRNKEDIIQAIFELYAKELATLFALDAEAPTEHLGSLQTSQLYLERVLYVIWRFRFAYDNLPDILARNESLSTWYRKIQEPVYDLMRRHMEELRSHGVLLVSDDDLDNMLHVMKQLLIFWVAYQRTLHPGMALSKSTVFGVIPKVLFLFRPYIVAEYLDELAGIEAYFRAKQVEEKAVTA
jgi:AcrR family transcriptional regulator